MAKINFNSNEKNILIGVQSFNDNLSNEDLKNALKISYNRISDNFKIKLEIKNIFN